MTARDCESVSTARQSDSKAWIRKAEDRVLECAMKAKRFTARLTIDITPELRGRIKVTAFQRGLMVAKTPRGPLAREFPQTQGGRFDG